MGSFFLFAINADNAMNPHYLPEIGFVLQKRLRLARGVTSVALNTELASFFRRRKPNSTRCAQSTSTKLASFLRNAICAPSEPNQPHAKLTSMPHHPSRALILAAAILSALAQAQAQTPANQVARILDDWHQAAANSDEARYFNHFAANGIFMGTDPAERWTVPAFRQWARPAFDGKRAWKFKARERHIDFSPDGKTAWFDELLDTANMGLCRGSGVLIRAGKTWKIAQYNLSVPIPNPLLDGVLKQIR
jgi:hypothetical protein